MEEKPLPVTGTKRVQGGIVSWINHKHHDGGCRIYLAVWATGTNPHHEPPTAADDFRCSVPTQKHLTQWATTMLDAAKREG